MYEMNMSKGEQQIVQFMENIIKKLKKTVCSVNTEPYLSLSVNASPNN